MAPIIFFICLGIVIVSFLGAAINMAVGVKSDTNFHTMFGAHMLAIAFIGIGSIGALVSGIFWLIQFLMERGVL